MAAQLDPKRREKLRRAIIQHIRKHGRAEWQKLHKQFPDVAERTIYRLAKQISDDDVGAEAGVELARTVKQMKRAAERAEFPEPTPISLAPRPPRGLDLIDKFHETWDGTQRQMAHAMNGKDGIRNVDLHHKTLELQGRLINIGNRLATSVFTVERMERMRAAMLEAIHEADPDTARKIVRKLQALHERHGLSEGR